MEDAIIDLPSCRLIVGRDSIFGAPASFVGFENIAKITTVALPSFWDEIGFIAEAKDGRVCLVRELSGSFQEFTQLFDFANLFGADWYERTEQGERFVWTPE